MKIPDAYYVILHSAGCQNHALVSENHAITGFSKLEVAAWFRDKTCLTKAGRATRCRLIRYDRQKDWGES